MSGSTLCQRVRAGHLPSFRSGRKLFTTRKWVEVYRAERHRKPGRPRAVRSLEDQYASCVVRLMSLDLPANFEELDDLLFQAARHLVAGHPRANELHERQLNDLMSHYRAVLVDGEPDASRRRRAGDRRAAVCGSTGRGRATPRHAVRRAHILPTVDPRIPGRIARLDVAAARELADGLRCARPAMHPGELFAAVAQAMLEGSENLPDGPQECREAIEATVGEALGQDG